MTLRQYSNTVVPSELLTEPEQLQLFKYFTLQPSLKSKLTIANFPMKPRLRSKSVDDSHTKKTAANPSKKKSVRFATTNQVSVTQLPAEPIYGSGDLDSREMEAQEVFG